MENNSQSIISLEEKIKEQENEILRYKQELSSSQLEAAALKVVNAKLLVQLQNERQTITTQEIKNENQSQQQQQQSNKKKKNNKNNNNQGGQESVSKNQGNVFDATIQDLLINLQIENKQLSNELLSLKEEVIYF